MTDPESNALLGFLKEHAGTPDFTCRATSRARSSSGTTGVPSTAR